MNVTQVLNNVKCKELNKQIILLLCHKRDSFGIKQGLILAFCLILMNYLDIFKAFVLMWSRRFKVIKFFLLKN